MDHICEYPHQLACGGSEYTPRSSTWVNCSLWVHSLINDNLASAMVTVSTCAHRLSGVGETGILIQRGGKHEMLKLWPMWFLDTALFQVCGNCLCNIC